MGRVLSVQGGLNKWVGMGTWTDIAAVSWRVKDKMESQTELTRVLIHKLAAVTFVSAGGAHVTKESKFYRV